MPPVDSLTRAASTYSEVGIITHVHRNLTQQAPTTWDQTSTYSSRALQGVSRDAGGRLGPASHVNELFRRGSPSNNLGQVGLIIHQFDELEVFGREWEMCTGGGCTCQGRHLHGRISASIVWQGLRERKDRVNIPLAFGDRAGILMNGKVLEITCGFGIDGSSYQDNSRFNPGCHSFCDASTILDPYGNLKDEAHGDWAYESNLMACGFTGGPASGWRPTDLKRLLETYHKYGHDWTPPGWHSGYNEMIFSSDKYNKALPSAVLAFFVLKGQPREGQMRGQDGGRDANFPQLHQDFLNTYGISAQQVPMLEFDPSNWETPFSELV